jgi:hypothetical protein
MSSKKQRKEIQEAKDAAAAEAAPRWTMGTIVVPGPNPNAPRGVPQKAKVTVVRAALAISLACGARGSVGGTGAANCVDRHA